MREGLYNTFGVTLAILVASTPAFAVTGQSAVPIVSMSESEVFADPMLRELAEAAARGNAARVADLVAKGADANGRGYRGITPIFFAIRAGRVDGANALLVAGADPNLIWEHGGSAVHMAAESGAPALLRVVLDHGGNPNLVLPSSGESPLFMAVGPESKANVNVLLQASVDTEIRRVMGRQTAVMRAAMLNQYDAVFALLQAGARYDARDFWGHDLTFYIQKSAQTMDPKGELSEWRQRCSEYIRSRSSSSSTN